MRLIRVRRDKANRLVAALRAAGYDADVISGPAHTSWFGGCGDPHCCPQHPAINDPDGKVWCDIQTTASGRQAHRIWVAAGLVQD